VYAVTKVVVKFPHGGYGLVGGVTEPAWRVGDINPLQLIDFWGSNAIENELKRIAGLEGQLDY
jgi:hypothetical protein